MVIKPLDGLADCLLVKMRYEKSMGDYPDPNTPLMR
jgi:hypothetical protein